VRVLCAARSGLTCRVHRRMYALVVGAVLTLFAFLLLTGRYINDGPILLRISDRHGLHAGDLFIIGGWTVGMTALVLLTTSRGPARHS
jgi:hypothetical protein